MEPEQPEEISSQDTDPEFPVVGIGASAGGLAAFERFFANLPPDTGMAYVVVQHLSPPHRSILPELLQRHTAMPVLQVTDGVEVRPNQVYVIPPGNNLALMDGHLILLKPATDRSVRFPIDFFLRSLAEARKQRAVGIVLSGTGNDGSLGIKNIKAGGGLTIAQEPETAEFGDMPRNAIATRDVDFVLPPENIGALILKYDKHQVHFPMVMGREESYSGLGSLQKLYYLIRSKTGHDFSLYKQNTLLRRIDRRMKVALVPDMEAYNQFMQERPEEIDALFHEMLINVTQFFREPEAFEALSEKAIQPLIQQKSAAQAPIRVWVAGCSSGEEAYSVAILIQEQLEASHTDCKVQIYATDLDVEAIGMARRGVYADGALENVSGERLKRFFVKEEDGFHVKKSIRDTIVFSNQNLIFDPPFSKIDLLCCRNVLIYLQSELQKQLFPLFHYSLNPGGYLFLGNSESAGGFTELFGVINRKHKIFQRKDVINEHRIHTRIQSSFGQAALAPAESGLRRASIGGLREWTEMELLKYHTPASAIIDEKYNILYIHGRTGKYLEPAAGEASNNLLRMAREGLKSELATAIHTAAAAHRTVTRKKIRVKTNGDYQFIDLTIRPVDMENSEPGLCLVVFEEVEAADPRMQPAASVRAEKDQQVGELEKALKEKDEYLTSIINELEDANQELKSVNEELLSSNEEMQSSNEELETSREELQSINEELSTVNAELQNKNVELTQLNNDVYNLLASTDIGTVFLDQDLQLRRYTPAIQRVYHFLPGDVGRPLSHFHSNLKYERLTEDIQQVLDTLAPKAIEAESREGVWYLINIQPYRTLENMIDGAVITFVDITRQKQRDELRRLETLLRDANDAIIVHDPAGNIQSWNLAAGQMYGWTEGEALSMKIQDLVPDYLREGTLDLYRRLFKGENVRPFESRRVTRNGRTLDVWVTPSVLFDYTNRALAISSTERDITDRKPVDQALRMENRALKALNEWHQSAARPTSPDALLKEACQALVAKAGYRLAWIGLAEKEGSPEYWAGFEGGEAEAGQAARTLAQKSRKLVDEALQSQRPALARNLLVDPAGKAFRSEALEYGFGSFLLLPLARGNSPLGVLAVYAGEAEAFFEAELEGLKGLAREISQKQESTTGMNG